MLRPPVQDPRDAEAVVLGVGRARERVLAGQARHDDVVAVDVGQRHGVGGRRHVDGRDLAHLGDGLQDDVELTSEGVELFIGDGKPREAREVRHLLAGNRGHRRASPSGRRLRRSVTCGRRPDESISC
jgi:hypothetical protein